VSQRDKNTTNKIKPLTQGGIVPHVKVRVMRIEKRDTGAAILSWPTIMGV